MRLTGPLGRLGRTLRVATPAPRRGLRSTGREGGRGRPGGHLPPAGLALPWAPAVGPEQRHSLPCPGCMWLLCPLPPRTGHLSVCCVLNSAEGVQKGKRDTLLGTTAVHASHLTHWSLAEVRLRLFPLVLGAQAPGRAPGTIRPCLGRRSCASSLLGVPRPSPSCPQRWAEGRWAWPALLSLGSGRPSVRPSRSCPIPTQTQGPEWGLWSKPVSRLSQVAGLAQAGGGPGLPTALEDCGCGERVRPLSAPPPR